MATALHGKDGIVKAGTVTVALVDSWDMTIDPALDDITAMDSSGWQQLMVGIKKTSGSIKVRYAADDTTGQTVLNADVIGGTALSLSLYPSGTANYFSGSAFLTEAITAAHNAPGERTFSFSSHGAWTYT